MSFELVREAVEAECKRVRSCSPSDVGRSFWHGSALGMLSMARILEAITFTEYNQLYKEIRDEVYASQAQDTIMQEALDAYDARPDEAEDYPEGVAL